MNLSCIGVEGLTIADIDKSAEGRRTRTGVRIQDCNALLAGFVLEEALFGAIVPRAGQAGEVDE